MCLHKLKSSAYLIGVLFCVLLSPLLASADDIYEVNDTLETAYDVAGLGNTLDAVMTYDYDFSDYYKLTVPSGVTSLEIGLTFPTATENIDLRLRDDQGTQLALSNGTTGTSEQISYTAPGGGNIVPGIYYMQVMTGTPSDGAYTLTWNQFAPAVSSPDPADGASVLAGAAGQLLRVTTSGASSCTIYYGVDGTTFTSVAGTMNGDFCETTVAYGSTMLNNGTNYWYVEATNGTGTTRFPEGASASLSFTVFLPPALSNPSPAAGATVLAGASGQLLQVDVANTDACTLFYGVDGVNFASTAGTIAAGTCQATVSYGANLTDNGINYWYAEGTNAAGGNDRLPATGSMQFSVYQVPAAANPVPATGSTVVAGASGQLLQVDVTDTDSCTFRYGSSGTMAGTVSAGTCQATVPYDGSNMTDSGTNSWYVELANTGGGSARYPATGTLTFTVYQTPVVSNESPVNGSTVKPGFAGQVLQAQVTYTDTCTLHYGVDPASLVTAAGVVASGYCKLTVPYGADMSNNGMNYWYIDAANTGGGAARYPASGTLSFTVKTSSLLPLLLPRIKPAAPPL